MTAASTGSTDTSRGDRVLWLDIGKGVAILLVVLHHTWQLMDASGWSLPWWGPFDSALTTLRMPFFFTVSGLLAARVITMGFVQLFQRKLALLLYLYFAWSVIRSLWFSVVPWPLDDFDPITNVTLAFLWPSNGLWYLYALVLYTLIAWGARSLPWFVTLGAATIASILVASLLVDAQNWVWNAMIVYLPFFLGGLYGRRLILDRVAGLKWPTALAVGMIYAGSYLVAELIGLVVGAHFVAFARVPLSVLGVAAGCAFAWLVVPTMIGRGFAGIGRRTLPVYVQHVLFLAVLVWLVPTWVPGVVGFILFPAVAIALSFGVFRVLGGVPGIFRLPVEFRTTAPTAPDRS